jgi:inositol 1,4,5-triphosphate receptor type 1/inositol 1,4,5-triphosphate receptor type 3
MKKGITTGKTIFNQEDECLLESSELSSKNKPTLLEENIKTVLQWCNNESWKNFLGLCEIQVKQELESEIADLALSFMNVDKLIPDQMKRSLNVRLEFTDLLKKLIKYIELGIMNKANKDNLIYGLQVLEEILNQAENLEEM